MSALVGGGRAAGPSRCHVRQAAQEEHTEAQEGHTETETDQATATHAAATARETILPDSTDDC